MSNKHPYTVIHSRYVTEKARVLEGLQNNQSNACVKKCVTPKYVFLVDPKATKFEIAQAIEEIYADKNIKVTGVNTVRMKPKPRTVRGRRGMKPGYKKAIVSLKPGNVIEDKT
jgi:large subunit ribosomal protein L23